MREAGGSGQNTSATPIPASHVTGIVSSKKFPSISVLLSDESDPLVLLDLDSLAKIGQLLDPEGTNVAALVELLRSPRLMLKFELFRDYLVAEPEGATSFQSLSYDLKSKRLLVEWKLNYPKEKWKQAVGKSSLRDLHSAPVSIYFDSYPRIFNFAARPDHASISLNGIEFGVSRFSKLPMFSEPKNTATMDPVPFHKFPSPGEAMAGSPSHDGADLGIYTTQLPAQISQYSFKWLISKP